MLATPEEVATAITRQLETAWNAATATLTAHSLPKTPTISPSSVPHPLAPVHRRRASGHLHTIYKGSTVRQTVADARALTGDVIIAHVNIVLNVPSGHRQRIRNALQTLIIINRDGVWRVAHFQNTLIVPH